MLIASSRPRVDLEVGILRRGVEALEASRCRCHSCRRTPLIGERVALYEDGRTLCALCRGHRREDPASTPVVRPGERGNAVSLRQAA